MAISHEISPDGNAFEPDNGALHTIIAELLVVNQELRWRLASSGGVDAGLRDGSYPQPPR
jgi:hypothetical protein